MAAIATAAFIVFKAIKYFDDVREEKLTWVEIIFNGVWGGGMKRKAFPFSISTKPSTAGVAHDV
jgi:hypothetical protein